MSKKNPLPHFNVQGTNSNSVRVTRLPYRAWELSDPSYDNGIMWKAPVGFLILAFIIGLILF